MGSPLTGLWPRAGRAPCNIHRVPKNKAPNFGSNFVISEENEIYLFMHLFHCIFWNMVNSVGFSVVHVSQIRRIRWPKLKWDVFKLYRVKYASTNVTERYRIFKECSWTRTALLMMTSVKSATISTYWKSRRVYSIYKTIWDETRKQRVFAPLMRTLNTRALSSLNVLPWEGPM